MTLFIFYGKGSIQTCETTGFIVVGIVIGVVSGTQPLFFHAGERDWVPETIIGDGIFL